MKKWEKKLKIVRLTEDSLTFQQYLRSAHEKQRKNQLGIIKHYVDEREHLIGLMKKYASMKIILFS